MVRKLICLLMLSISYSSYTQSNYIVTKVPKTEIGIVGGITKTRLTGSEDVNYSRRRTGVLGGISFIKNINLTTSVNVELLYAQRSWEDYSNLLGPTDTMSYNAIVKAGYFVLPILGKFQFGGMRNFLIEVGIQSSFLMGNVNWSEDSGLESDISERLKTFDAGLLMGFGSQFRMKDKGHFFIKIRNYFGLTGYDNVMTSDSKRFNANTVQLVFGITRFLSN